MAGGEPRLGTTVTYEALLIPEIYQPYSCKLHDYIYRSDTDQALTFPRSLSKTGVKFRSAWRHLVARRHEEAVEWADWALRENPRMTAVFNFKVPLAGTSVALKRGENA